jgi:hypothetical protein
VQEPFDHDTARTFVRHIVDDKGTYAIPGSAWKTMRDADMTSGDVANVLRGGRITGVKAEGDCWRYQSRTNRMIVEFCFRWNGVDSTHAAPNEVVILSARRSKP